jgi:RibD C-terminal domain
MSLPTPAASASVLQPLKPLYEAPGLAAFDLPDELTRLYGGPLGFSGPRLYANFVASLDGVTAIPDELRSSHLIAAGSEADRFVMGLLRACADAVLVGAGTLDGSPRTLWTAEHAYPEAAPLHHELRRRRGRPPQPTLAVLSGSGRIDPQHPKFLQRTLILTSEQGAARLGDRLPGSNDGRPDRRRAAARAGRGGRGASGRWSRADPLRGRADAVRRSYRGRTRGRALPDTLAAARRPLRRRVAALAARRRRAAARPDGQRQAADAPASGLASLSALRVPAGRGDNP